MNPSGSCLWNWAGTLHSHHFSGPMFHPSSWALVHSFSPGVRIPMDDSISISSLRTVSVLVEKVLGLSDLNSNSADCNSCLPLHVTNKRVLDGQLQERTEGVMATSISAMLPDSCNHLINLVSREVSANLSAIVLLNCGKSIYNTLKAWPNSC